MDYTFIRNQAFKKALEMADKPRTTDKASSYFSKIESLIGRILEEDQKALQRFERFAYANNLTEDYILTDADFIKLSGVINSDTIPAVNQNILKISLPMSDKEVSGTNYKRFCKVTGYNINTDEETITTGLKIVHYTEDGLEVPSLEKTCTLNSSSASLTYPGMGEGGTDLVIPNEFEYIADQISNSMFASVVVTMLGAAITFGVVDSKITYS